MDMSPKVSLILPAFNERASIGATIQEARDYFQSRGLTHEIIVAADGNDGTRELVSEMALNMPGLRVLGSEQRRGKGYGIRQAVQIAAGRIIGFADADNKTPLEEFDSFRTLLDDGCDLVIGSRGLPQSRIEKPQRLYRRLGSWGFRMVMHSIIALPGIGDTQCGFKFFQRNIVGISSGDRRSTATCSTWKSCTLPADPATGSRRCPVRWRDDGDSRLVLFSGNIRNVLDIFKIRYASSPTRLASDAGARPRDAGRSGADADVVNDLHRAAYAWTLSGTHWGITEMSTSGTIWPKISRRCPKSSGGSAMTS